VSTVIAAPTLISRWRQRLWRVAPADLDTIVLRHSRISILPTRRGLALIATLTIMLLTSMNYALSLGFALTFLAGGLAQRRCSRRLTCPAAPRFWSPVKHLPGRLEFSLSLASGGRERTGIVTTPADGPPVEVDLPAGATRPVRLSVVARRRGRLPLGRVTLSSDFPLGLWRGWAYVHFPLTASVYPLPEASPPPLPPGHQGSDARLSAPPRQSLRDCARHQRGDAQNRIA
jgi:uncharacterized protein (DUF58 family)